MCAAWDSSVLNSFLPSLDIVKAVYSRPKANDVAVNKGLGSEATLNMSVETPDFIWPSP